MLEEARANCDFLIVGLQVDPSIDRPEKNKPVQSVTERFIQLSAVKFVDKIIPYSTERDLEDLIQSQPINIRFIGEEYKHKDFTGKTYCEDAGIELYYNSRRHRFSSSELRSRIS